MTTRPLPALTDKEQELARALTGMAGCGDGTAQVTEAEEWAQHLTFAFRARLNQRVLEDLTCEIAQEGADADQLMVAISQPPDKSTVVIFGIAEGDDPEITIHHQIWGAAATSLTRALVKNVSFDHTGGPNGQSIIRGRSLTIELVNTHLNAAATELGHTSSDFALATQIITDIEGNSAVWHL